jgi:tetratricopeptide (TPR) repeat protein
MMRISKFDSFLLFAAASFFIAGFSGACGRHNASPSPVTQQIPAQTGTDAEIEEAEKIAGEYPDLAKSHNNLAAVLLRKVRETGDYSLNREAEKSIRRALEIEPDNADALVLQTQIYLSEHKFREALEAAQSLELRSPNNFVAISAMTDALTELGRYEEAVRMAQKLVDLRPNAASYTRVARLRQLYGDVEGAIEARRLAVRIADPQDREALAWYHAELGTELFNAGLTAEAEREFDAALRILPEYHWALAGKGKARAALGDLETAITIYQKLYDRVPQIDRAVFLGDLYQKLGRTGEATKIYDETVKREKNAPDGDMHRVALFWADHDLNLDEALEIARRDRAENADLLSSDTLAWCLYKKKNFGEAKKSIDEAMRLKTKNALFFYHKGMIEAALGNRRAAAENLKLALQTNPAFDLLQAEVAKKTLDELSK